MVCDRCKLVVLSELKMMGIESISIKLGEIVLKEPMDIKQKNAFRKRLEELGFALIDDKKSRLVERIKTSIIESVHYNQNGLKIKLSDYLSDKLNHDYNYMSNLFSEVEGTTIEKYFIAQKIEKVKELLAYEELNLNEIAFQLNYSSTAHLSNQFKKVTGMSPNQFRQLKPEGRKSLDEV